MFLDCNPPITGDVGLSCCQQVSDDTYPLPPAVLKGGQYIPDINQFKARLSL